MIHDQGQIAAWRMAKARVSARRNNGADTSIVADRVDRFRREEDGSASILNSIPVSLHAGDGRPTHGEPSLTGDGM